MSRPSEAEIREALATFSALVDDADFVGGVRPVRRRSRSALRGAVRTLREAVKPREVWPAKEAAACLGVRVSNLKTVKDLPAPAWSFDRSRPDFPYRVHVLYWRDEIEAHPKAIETAARRAEKEGGT